MIPAPSQPPSSDCAIAFDYAAIANLYAPPSYMLTMKACPSDAARHVAGSPRVLPVLAPEAPRRPAALVRHVRRECRRAGFDLPKPLTSNGWGLTLLFAPLKSRLYGGAA